MKVWLESSDDLLILQGSTLSAFPVETKDQTPDFECDEKFFDRFLAVRGEYVEMERIILQKINARKGQILLRLRLTSI